eukprot:TRINITY_DN13379_c0_g3_i1.p1 TRINITY_DN13379_c0_g3~~TRINITY_DN13379_c0_g3_i1.p1  ORF type:complete len:318 (-),score=36.81 TRINITY_DN13379_c0_g3_i1:43-888(-)
MATLQVAPELLVHLTVKHTFFHYELFGNKLQRTSSSCPPRVRFAQGKHSFIEDGRMDLAKSIGLQNENTFIKQDQLNHINFDEVQTAAKEKSGGIYDTLRPVKREATSEFENGRLTESTKSCERSPSGAVVVQPRKFVREGGQKVNRGTDGKPRQSEDTCLILRGLPYQIAESEIKDFLSENGALAFLSVIKPVTIIFTPTGKPSGLAELRLAPFADMALVRSLIDFKYLGGRYVEVFLPNTSVWRAAVQMRRGKAGGDNKPGWKSSARRTSAPFDRDCRW